MKCLVPITLIDKNMLTHKRLEITFVNDFGNRIKYYKKYTKGISHMRFSKYQSDK